MVTGASRQDRAVTLPPGPTQAAVERVVRSSAAAWAGLWIVGISFAVVSQLASLRLLWIAAGGLVVLAATSLL